MEGVLEIAINAFRNMSELLMVTVLVWSALLAIERTLGIRHSDGFISASVVLAFIVLFWIIAALALGATLLMI